MLSSLLEVLGLVRRDIRREIAKHPLHHRGGRVTLALEPLEDRVVPTTYNVTNVADTGAGSLRAAITAGNTAGGSHTILFPLAFPEGVPSLTIFLGSALPKLTADFTINGLGASVLSVRATLLPASFASLKSTPMQPASSRG